MKSSGSAELKTHTKLCDSSSERFSSFSKLKKAIRGNDDNDNDGDK